MVKSGAAGDGNCDDVGSPPIAPFLIKCYEMVEDEANKAVVSWTDIHNSFVINDETDFTLRLLPKYWKHNNFSSFMRQLNIYGFRKVDADRWEFANDGFMRGQRHLLKTISRRKNIQGTDHRKSVKQIEKANKACDRVEYFDLWNEVHNLQIDKKALMQELVDLRQHQEMLDNKLLLLRDRLKGMEKNQQQMLSFLVMAMRNPGYFVKLLQPREHNWPNSEKVKNANMLERVMEVSEAAVTSDVMLATDGTVVRYRPPTYQEGTCPPSLPSKCFSRPKFEIAEGMQEFFMDSELMKTLMDENQPMLDYQSTFVLPDLHDDGLLDHFVFSSPLIDNC
uniref:HSF-type DNA-binding domain-containing protein n=1 Tax=Kalanchoe fedtschenkoi TaxID=63787 RepID=A0A7N0TLT8_KALFE